MSSTLVGTESFIEAQFPVSKLSKESYKERKANHSQTLTGLGKWWGRKPLILVRATLLGLLLPSTDDPARDREVFLKLLTMDSEGLLRRKSKGIAISRIVDLLDSWEVMRYFPQGTEARRRLTDEERELRREAERLAFDRMRYDEKLEYCARPEQIDGPSPEAWAEINAHLGTSARSLPELVRELGERRFGHVPRVGDAFCGGGSIPFEAARMGCEAYGSDLNPVAALLTWSALNIVGGGDAVAELVRMTQRHVYDAVDRQISAWGIEHNEQGWRADAYLYCVETTCPECRVRVPLAPSWVIGERTRTVAKLRVDLAASRMDVDIVSGASDAEMRAAKHGTVRDNALYCPNPACGRSTPVTMLRGDRRGATGTDYGLRPWENDDIVPRPDDVFGERLYCIRWVETYIDNKGEEKTRRLYRAPDEHDLRREQRVLALLGECFHDWQEKGYVPSRRIEEGAETNRLVRERGWTHWHHLFNPRQLLSQSLILKQGHEDLSDLWAAAASILSVGRCCNFNSRLTRWVSNAANEKGADAFGNQTFNTLQVYVCRPFPTLGTLLLHEFKREVVRKNIATVADARSEVPACDIWITDPPYADAINYHELGEFFLAWYDKPLQRIFPDWYTDSKRALAVTGSDDNFRQSMVECYRNLAERMPVDGMQVVMFTHQDAGVWADLALILWAAGLRVTAAWTIGTETDSSFRTGNYVQGTVLLVLRKQTSDEVAFLDEIYPQVEAEVRSHLDAMLAVDDAEDPNFGDTDYQLAAYAAALRVLTGYGRIQDLDVARELAKPRMKGQAGPVERIIADAVKIAADHLVPLGFDPFTWKTLAPEERFYLKGLDLESHGELRAGAFQELARGFGIREYRDLLGSGVANETRLKSATEFGARMLGGEGFGGSLVRHCLFAVREAAASESAAHGRQWLKTEAPQYWTNRRTLIEILRYLASRGQHLRAWRAADADAARLVAGALENDSV